LQDKAKTFVSIITEKVNPIDGWIA